MRFDKVNKKAWISVGTLLVFAAGIASLAIATDRLVNSFRSEADPDHGDWSIDEKEFGL
ncbi:MAG: hypothetical protein IJH95_04310 [Mogibacterium sp.]|nr:hypothetical protein [Mogibacterium sp.]